MRALERATATSAEAPEALKLMVLRESRPTAITVSNIIRLSVTTRAKPFLVFERARFGEWVFMQAILTFATSLTARLDPPYVIT